ncbi:MAG: hypothetical protein Q7T44_11650 [Parvibaculum sp.]|nr:hypothetical protein [Parvibaculum sp.]
MDIELATNDPLKSLVLQDIEKLDDGHEHEPGNNHYVCNLVVVSDWLRFHIRFYFQKRYLTEALENLIGMSQGVAGEAIIKEEYETTYIGFRMDKLGHVTVFGAVLQGPDDQTVKFSFNTDQTILPSLISDLKKV